MICEITIKWRQDYDLGSVDTAPVKLETPAWHDFDISDINHMPRNHALRLFSNSTPVVAKEGAEYITNSPAIFSQYRSGKKPVRMFSDIQPSEAKLVNCGFLGA